MSKVRFLQIDKIEKVGLSPEQADGVGAVVLAMCSLASIATKKIEVIHDTETGVVGVIT